VLYESGLDSAFGTAGARFSVKASGDVEGVRVPESLRGGENCAINERTFL
jgi:hypothetical protein